MWLSALDILNMFRGQNFRVRQCDPTNPHLNFDEKLNLSEKSPEFRVKVVVVDIPQANGSVANPERLCHFSPVLGAESPGSEGGDQPGVKYWLSPDG